MITIETLPNTLHSVVKKQLFIQINSLFILPWLYHYQIITNRIWIFLIFLYRPLTRIDNVGYEGDGNESQSVAHFINHLHYAKFLLKGNAR